MAEAIVSTTVERLGDLLIQEASFLAGVGNQVQELRAELQGMQCFLRDADKRRQDESVRNWVTSIRKLAYKTENVLETYAIKVESRKGKGIKKALKRFACLFAEWVNLHQIGLEIGNIKNEIDRLTRSLDTYGIKREKEGESSNSASKNLLRETFAHEIEEHFVGMQNDVDRLVSLLVDSDKDHRIISIYGMGGIGKTTLAKQVFNHKDVQNCFESFAWVAVSQQFEPNSLLREILRQLAPKRDVYKMEYRELVEELCKAQRSRKCLVVLDDIWKEENWKVLSHAFPITEVHCKVLLTTRIQGVAEIGTAHKPNLFSEEEGWQLLKKKAVTSANARDPNVQAGQEILGKEMVRKCGYLPLAISVIGGILSKKNTLEEWEKVKKDIDSYLSGDEGINKNYQVMQILALSYEDLPYQLKPCFLYLAYYPEDKEIYIQELFFLWIAEGMVLSRDRQRNDETLMEVADKYLNELVSRSLIQVQSYDCFDSIWNESCHIHDLLRDLCLRKCKDEDFMDFRVGKQLLSDLDSLGGNAYKLVIYGDEADNNVLDKILQKTNESTRLVSVRDDDQVMDQQFLSQELEDLKNLRFLKTVAFEGLEFSNTKLLHRALKKLIHLRLLSFKDCKLAEMPSSIATLPYLQTFYCVDCDQVKIPNVFWKLKRLIHLVLLDGFCSDKFRLDCLSGLETLLFSDSFSIDVKALPKLTNLRVFSWSVKDNESLSLIIDCIEVNWYNIRDVRLSIYPNCDFISTADGPILLRKLLVCRALKTLAIENVRIEELPKYESARMLAPSDLVHLRLAACFIGEDPMPTLERLPKLRRLSLSTDSFVGEELTCRSIGFPNLRYLHLHSLPNLKKWTIEEGALPNLSTVTIRYCRHLEMIPDGMKFLKSLIELQSEGMPVEFNNRIRVVNGQEGADFHKVRHVPLISIEDEGGNSFDLQGSENSSDLQGSENSLTYEEWIAIDGT